MIININDSLDGKSRKKILLQYPIIYSMLLNENNITHAAEWLGLCRRGLFNVIRRNDELRAFIHNKTLPDNGALPEDTYHPRHSLKKLFDNHLMRTQSTFWWNTCSTEDKVRFIERLKKLYSLIEDNQCKEKKS